MASTQSDDMENFQRLSDQYQPEVTVVDFALLCKSRKPLLTVLGTINWAEAICSSFDHRVCPRGSNLPDEDGRERYRTFHPWRVLILSSRLCRRHTPNTGPSEEMANVAGEVWTIPLLGSL